MQPIKTVPIILKVSLPGDPAQTVVTLEKKTA